MDLGGLTRPSLVRRLVLLALGWSIAALVITAAVMAFLFERTAVSRIDQTLNELYTNLVTYSTVDEHGHVFAPLFTDERALRVYSGRYWEIAEYGPDGKVVPMGNQKSHSLFDTELAPPPDFAQRMRANSAAVIRYNAVGPQDQPLRALARQNALPGRKAPVIFLAAEDRSSVNRDVRRFVVSTAAAFIVLGAGLVGAIIFQVRIGLRPLFALQEEVAAVRRGKSLRLAGEYPSELKPLAHELNALVEHNQQTVERQRTHVGNLAHALKTPISVIVTEAAQRPGPLAEVVTRQAEAMRDQVDHHLRRARAAARAQGQGERTPLAAVLDELARTMERIFRDKGVSIDWDAPDDLVFLGERQDLMEIAGNAMENACKWCRGKVRVRAEAISPERLTLVVEDDGAGLPEDRRDDVLRRGARLDESAPGSGLGLSIIDELARAYGGALRLQSSSLGGLRVEADLPRADA